MLKKNLTKAIPIVGLLVIWAICSNYVNPLFLPKPTKVLQSFGELFSNGMLFKSLEYSFLRITVATLLSAAVSIPLGLLVVNYKVANTLITPITNFMRFFPVTAFYPLLIMFLGIGEEMKVTFLFCATVFYFLPSVILCVKETNHDLVDTALTMGMTKIQVLFKVLLPSALPSICKTFLMMYGIGWTYAIVAETINAQYGLGFMMNIASARGRTDLVFVALITIIVFSVIFDGLGNMIIKKTFKWKFAREVGD
jgi:NitT/TauT family transport system permease protein